MYEDVLRHLSEAVAWTTPDEDWPPYLQDQFRKAQGEVAHARNLLKRWQLIAEVATQE
jgi:hypothetical protein